MMTLRFLAAPTDVSEDGVTVQAGRVLEWIDKAGYACAVGYSGGYCVTACPFGVVDVDRHGDGKAHKCTLCYDRLKDGMEPACAKACPTDSIRFGPVDELLELARERVVDLRSRGIPAYLYGSDGILEEECDTTEIDGLNCFFLLIDRPEVYNLPPVPHRPASETAPGLLSGAIAAGGLVAAAMLAFAGAGRE